jgi:plasmid stabilization system protein ParE
VASSELGWHPGAIVEAEEARDWYELRSPLAARGFLLELQAAVRAVSEAPGRWPDHLHGTRRCLFLHRYPFSLVYVAGPPVQVVAVAHERRRPGYWRERTSAV